MLKIVDNGTKNEKNEKNEKDAPIVALDALVRQGAQRMLQAAIEAEVAEYVDVHKHERDAEGRRLVVRNGSAKPRKIVAGAGEVYTSGRDRFPVSPVPSSLGGLLCHQPDNH